MKILIFLLIFTSAFNASAQGIGVSGKVESSLGCAKKVMVWLSLDHEERQGRQLLLHTEVPVGGSFKFYTKAGKYQIRASDEAGCESLSQVTVEEKEVKVAVKLVKK